MHTKHMFIKTNKKGQENCLKKLAGNATYIISHKNKIGYVASNCKTFGKEKAYVQKKSRCKKTKKGKNISFLMKYYCKISDNN